MGKCIDLTGKLFGKWEVLYRNGTKNTFAVWRCRCILCKKEHDIVGQTLVQGRSTKCRSCSASQAKLKPFSNDAIKHIFSAMWQRCYDKNHIAFHHYGGRGIKICDEWLNNRQSFYEWAYQNGYSKGLSIERKDFNKGYSPDNCCFIPKSKQPGNRRNNIMVTINGETQCFAWWCKKLNISASTVKYRAEKNKISYEEAIKAFL